MDEHPLATPVTAACVAPAARSSKRHSQLLDQQWHSQFTAFANSSNALAFDHSEFAGSGRVR
jgi:hypothetical protein